MPKIGKLSDSNEIFSLSVILENFENILFWGVFHSNPFSITRVRFFIWGGVHEFLFLFSVIYGKLSEDVISEKNAISSVKIQKIRTESYRK